MKVKLTCGFDVSTRLRKNPPHVHKPGICFSTNGLGVNLDEIPIEPSESEQESGSESVENSESESASESAEESETSQSTEEESESESESNSE